MSGLNIQQYTNTDLNFILSKLRILIAIFYLDNPLCFINFLFFIFSNYFLKKKLDLS